MHRGSSLDQASVKKVKDAAAAVWVVAVNLLGTGAERLDSERDVL